MTQVKEPGVESEIRGEDSNTPVSQSIQVIVPVDSPSGESDPAYLDKIGDLYKKYGSSSKPSANDHISMLQAFSILQDTAIWVVRLHENKVYEGVTAEGLPFFTDKNKNLIKNRIKIILNPPTDIYNNMYLLLGETLFYTGEKPSLEETVSEEIQLNATHHTYKEFFDLIAAAHPEHVSITISGNDNDGYKIISNGKLNAYSSNLTGVVANTAYSIVNINAEATDEVTIANYVMLNDLSFHPLPFTPQTVSYPSEDKSIEFIYADLEGTVSGVQFYAYMLNIILDKYRQILTGVSGVIKYIVGVSDAQSETVDATVTSNIDEGLLKIKKDAETKQSTIEASPSTEFIDNGYIKIEAGDKSYAIYVGSAPQATVLYPVTEKVTAAKLAVMLYELIAAEKVDEALHNTASAVLATTDKLVISIDASKVYTYSIDLPSDTTEGDVTTIKFRGTVENTNNIKLTDVAIEIDDTAYIVGNPQTSKTSIVSLSGTKLSINEIADALHSSLGNSFNAYCNNNVVDTFLTSSELPDIRGVGLQLSQKRSSYEGIEDTALFGVILKFNSRDKVAKFNWSYDSDNDYYLFSGTVNGDSYTTPIEFNDPSRADGYGKSLYYQYFNDQFKSMEIIPFSGETSQVSYESYTFGNAIAFNKAGVAELDAALSKLANYKFTKWDIVADGGFVSPAEIAVINKWNAKLKQHTPFGAPGYSSKADLINYSNNLPVNTQYVTGYYPPFTDTSFEGFTVKMSAGVQIIKRIIANTRAKNEFQPILGASYGQVSGVPTIKVAEESDRSELLGAYINTILYSDELKLSYVNDNITRYVQENPVQEENIVRMANAATHVAEVWLELNAVGHFNNLSLRQGIELDVAETIKTRLKSAIKPYKGLEVICNESNGNDDSKTEVIVDAYLTPYRAAKRIKLFTIVKSLERKNNNQ